MSIQKLIEELLARPEIDNIYELGDILGFRPRAHDRIDDMLYALLNFKRLQQEFLESTKPIRVWQTSLHSRPTEIVATELPDGSIITESLYKHALSGEREVVSTDFNQFRFFKSREHALKWRYRSCLACEKKNMKGMRDYILQAEADVRNLEREQDYAKTRHKMKYSSPPDGLIRTLGEQYGGPPTSNYTFITASTTNAGTRRRSMFADDEAPVVVEEVEPPPPF